MKDLLISIFTILVVVPVFIYLSISTYNKAKPNKTILLLILILAIFVFIQQLYNLFSIYKKVETTNDFNKGVGLSLMIMSGILLFFNIYIIYIRNK